MLVAWIDVAPGVDYSNDRFFQEVSALVTHLEHARAVAKRAQVSRPEPPLASKFAESLGPHCVAPGRACCKDIKCDHCLARLWCGALSLNSPSMRATAEADQTRASLASSSASFMLFPARAPAVLRRERGCSPHNRWE